MARKSGFLLALCSGFVVMTASECPDELEQFCSLFPNVPECQGDGETGAIETQQPELAVDEKATTDLVEAEPDEIGS